MQSKVAAKDLRIGMFVADLDRPWIDTPFLLQGFLIEDGQQILQLQQHCEYVIVDRTRSVDNDSQKQQEQALKADPGVAVVRKAPPVVTLGVETVGTPNRSAVAPLPPDAPRPSSRGEGSLLGGLVNSLRGLVRRSRDPAADDLPADTAAGAPESFLPDSTPLATYPDVHSVEEEVAPARLAYDRSAEVLDQMAADVWKGHPVEFERVEEAVDEMVESMIRNPDALMWVTRLRARDTTTYQHGLMVAVYLVAFGRHLGFPRDQLSLLGSIGLLLDIGKIRLPRELLLKKARLTAEEFETAKTHVALGLEILSSTPNWPAEVLEGIAQHHERMNGSGYPSGLRGPQIGIYGRMAGIADCFAALTKARPYAEAVSSYEALRSITSWGGQYFHEPLTEQFIQAIGVFPVGSLVELSTGEVAVVVSHNKVRRLKPRVLLLTSPDKVPSAYPVMADLLYDPKLGGEEPAFIKRSLPSGAFGLDPRENYLS